MLSTVFVSSATDNNTQTTRLMFMYGMWKCTFLRGWLNRYELWEFFLRYGSVNIDSDCHGCVYVCQASFENVFSWDKLSKWRESTSLLSSARTYFTIVPTKGGVGSSVRASLARVSPRNQYSFCKSLFATFSKRDVFFAYFWRDAQSYNFVVPSSPVAMCNGIVHLLAEQHLPRAKKLHPLLQLF